MILFPIVQQYGIGGLLIATMMAGTILVILGVSKMGRLIQFAPYPVILGFTAGIAVVIAVLQIPDFLGLQTDKLGEHFVENLMIIIRSLPTLNPLELGIGLFALIIMLLWPRLKTPIPAPLIGLVVGAIAAYLLNLFLSNPNTGNAIETIASRFTWEVDGRTGVGIPPIPPTLLKPWLLPGADGQPLEISFELIRALMGPAFAIAMLGAIESLLCAVIGDGLTKTKHDPNAELIGQGLGNLVAPLFGGITATAAIARTATNIRSGARSPIAAIIHSGVVLLAVVALAGLLALVPMAALAALLFIVAWNMSEAKHFKKMLKTAPAGDVAILITCFLLTVLFDMVLAVAVGVGLAAALFIRRMSLLTHAEHIKLDNHPIIYGLPKQVLLYDIDGPLFFGAAEKALTSLQQVNEEITTVILDMHDVTSMDGTAIAMIQTLLDDMKADGINVIIVGLQARMILKLRRAGIKKTTGKLIYCRDLAHAKTVALKWYESNV